MSPRAPQPNVAIVQLGSPGPGDETAAGAAGTYAAEPPGAASEANEDVAPARKLWLEIKDYATWNEPDAFSGWQEGKSPHGAILRYHVNDVAQRDLEADGVVIVKANYAERSDEALESLTVMQKRAGYDPQTGDWFYAKLSPPGYGHGGSAGDEAGRTRRQEQG